MTSMPTERSKINNRATDDDVRRNVVNNVNDQRDLEMILMGREDGEWLGLIRSPRSRNGATFFLFCFQAWFRDAPPEIGDIVVGVCHVGAGCAIEQELGPFICWK